MQFFILYIFKKYCYFLIKLKAEVGVRPESELRLSLAFDGDRMIELVRARIIIGE